MQSTSLITQRNYSKITDGTREFTHSSSSEIIIETKQAFLHYYNENYLGKDFNLLLKAYALDRRYNLDYITPKGIELCHRTIIRIREDSGATLEQAKSTIFLEFDHYKRFKNNYKMTNCRATYRW